MATPALVGELVILILLVGLVWAVFREVARVALKVIVPVGIVTGLAVWLGLLDQTVVGTTLAAVGEGVLTGIHSVADWITGVALSG